MDFKHVLSFLAMSVTVALIAGCNKAENEEKYIPGGVAFDRLLHRHVPCP
jgi:hypothetical protein